MLKKIIKKISNSFGYDIIQTKYKEFYSVQDLDKIFKTIFQDKDLVIFDVGANVGQSINRFSKIFPNSSIHSFEPIKENYLNVKKKFKGKDIYINNYAVGETICKKNIFVNADTGTSSFYPINKNSKWAKIRSKEHSMHVEDFSKKEEVNVITLDKYCEENNIKKIDILKIDVQGYEDKVLEGAENMLKKKKINTLEIEINFSNHYENKLSFYDIEKYLAPNEYEICAIKNTGWHFLNNSTTWFLDCIYKNRYLE